MIIHAEDRFKQDIKDFAEVMNRPPAKIIGLTGYKAEKAEQEAEKLENFIAEMAELIKELKETDLPFPLQETDGD